MIQVSLVALAPIAVMVGLLASAFVFSRFLGRPEGMEGVVVNKSAYTLEADGGYLQHYLVVETSAGSRFNLPVSPQEYLQVEIGMFVKRDGVSRELVFHSRPADDR